MKIKGVWSKDKELLSIQVMTDRMEGRPFPAWTGLVEILKDGKIIDNKQRQDFRGKVIKTILKEEVEE